MADDLKIVFPTVSHDKREKPIPSTFVATGWVKAVIGGGGQPAHKVRGVRAKLAHYIEGDKCGAAIAGKGRFIRPVGPAPDPKSLQWAVIFKQAGCGGAAVHAKLTIEALKENDAVITSSALDLWLKPNKGTGPTKGPPSVDWPDTNGYDIQGDELDLFFTMGASDLPVLSVKIDNTNGYFETYPDENFWWAAFSDLRTTPGGGDNRTLQATNADDTGTRRVDIKARK